MVPIDTVSVAHVAIGAGRAALPDAAAAPPFFILFSHPRRRTLRTSPQPPDGDQNGGENRAYCKSSNRFAEKRRSLASVTRHPSVMTAELIADQRSTINDQRSMIVLFHRFGRVTRCDPHPGSQSNVVHSCVSVERAQQSERGVRRSGTYGRVGRVRLPPLLFHSLFPLASLGHDRARFAFCFSTPGTVLILHPICLFCAIRTYSAASNS